MKFNSHLAYAAVTPKCLGQHIARVREIWRNAGNTSPMPFVSTLLAF